SPDARLREFLFGLYKVVVHSRKQADSPEKRVRKPCPRPATRSCAGTLTRLQFLQPLHERILPALEELNSRPGKRRKGRKCGNEEKERGHTYSLKFRTSDSQFSGSPVFRLFRR